MTDITDTTCAASGTSDATLEATSGPLLEELAHELEDEDDEKPFVCEHDYGVGGAVPDAQTRTRRRLLVRMISDSKCYSKGALSSLCFNQCRVCCARARRGSAMDGAAPMPPPRRQLQHRQTLADLGIQENGHTPENEHDAGCLVGASSNFPMRPSQFS